MIAGESSAEVAGRAGRLAVIENTEENERKNQTWSGVSMPIEPWIKRKKTFRIIRCILHLQI